MRKIPEFNPSSWNGFIVADPERARGKVERIRQAGAFLTRLELDADWTLFIDSLWVLTRHGMEKSRRQEHEALSRAHVALLENDTLTWPVAYRWQSRALRLLTKSSVSSIEQHTAQARARAGAKATLDIAGERGVARHLRTATCDIAVKSALQANGLKIDHIDATVMQHENDSITGYDGATLTHDLGKAGAPLRNPELAESVRQRPYAIVVGDRMIDTFMSDRPDDLRIRAVDGKVDFTDEKAVQKCLIESFNLNNDERYPHAYDAIIIDPHLFGLAALTNYTTTPIGQPVPELYVPEY